MFTPRCMPPASHGPALSAAELLEVSMIHSVAGLLSGGRLSDRSPSGPRIIRRRWPPWWQAACAPRPGEASLAHHGVLFLGEFPEFSPQALDALRQPLETGECIIARANHRAAYPANIQLVAAMNPCRCGMAGEPGHSCARPTLHDGLPGAHIRSANGSHRHPYRCACRLCRRSYPTDACRKERGYRPPRCPYT
ncbi:hypothetical protein FHT71_004353 [Rhizobium sp. BK060]|nr:hypothetical protein [Rhizobium sp. BK060]